MFFGVLAGIPCLGSPCIAGASIGNAAQTAGAILMLVIVFALAWYGNKNWRARPGLRVWLQPDHFFSDIELCFIALIY
jgi:hypothetical protein